MQQLTGLDTFFLNLETNAVPMNVGGLVLLDPSTAPNGFSFESARRLIESRLHRLTAFRRRLIMAPLNLDMPYWIEDPDFDIENHVRHRALPRPGTAAQLREFICEALATRLDRERPLWEMTYIEGLEDGRVALLWKVHHACMDGLGGVDVMGVLVDAKPLAVPDDMPSDNWRPEPLPSPAQLYGATLRSLATKPSEAWRLLNESLPLLFSAGRAALAQHRASVRSRHDGGSSVSVAPRTRFNTAINARRSYAFCSVPLSQLKAIKDAFEVSANDVVLAASAHALREYLIEHDELPAKPLITAVPVSVRSRAQRGEVGNQIKFKRMSLATNIEDPIKRLQHISAAAALIRDGSQRNGSVNLLGDWAEVPAPALMVQTARLYEHFSVHDFFRPPFNLIISNVPGPRAALYFAGARVDDMYPASIPYHGLGLNITVLSYRGRMHVGFTAHRNTVPDIDHLMDLWLSAVELYHRRGLQLQRKTGVEAAPERSHVAEPTPQGNAHA